MTIVRVSYQRTVNLGNYENIRVGGEAEVEINESEDAAIEALSAFVDKTVAQMKPRPNVS